MNSGQHFINPFNMPGTMRKALQILFHLILKLNLCIRTVINIIHAFNLFMARNSLPKIYSLYFFFSHSFIEVNVSYTLHICPLINQTYSVHLYIRTSAQSCIHRSTHTVLHRQFKILNGSFTLFNFYFIYSSWHLSTSF